MFGLNFQFSKNCQFYVTYIALMLSVNQCLHAQDTPAWHFSGYVKNMQTGVFFNDSYPDLAQFKLVDTFLMEELIHQRLNAEWDINESFSFHGAIRNRIIAGDFVRSTPDYIESLDEGVNDFFDLAATPVQSGSALWHTAIDRAYLEFVKGNWEVRLGRQRINWGINAFWNPNDLFNAYAFTDFDYEERPGSDAIRVKYYTGFASSVEVAANVSAFDSLDAGTIAGLWKFNKKNYDFQLLTGLSNNNFVVGGGWAGNMKEAGFKGEFSWFKSLDDAQKDGFTIATGVDYSFKNSLYFQGGYLYNSLGITETSNNAAFSLFTVKLSAKNLYPYKHTFYVQASYPATPLLNTALSVIYSPNKQHFLFLNPVVTYSIKENWDVDLVGQLLFNKADEKYTSPLQALFLRLKFSY